MSLAGYDVWKTTEPVDPHGWLYCEKHCVEFAIGEDCDECEHEHERDLWWDQLLAFVDRRTPESEGAE